MAVVYSITVSIGLRRGSLEWHYHNEGKHGENNREKFVKETL